MKAVEFDETQINELEKISYKLFEDEFAPRSNAYKRIIIRPKVNWIGLFFWIVIPVLCVTMLLCVFDLGEMEIWYRGYITLVLVIVYIGVTAKWAAISIIKIYQRFAPESV